MTETPIKKLVIKLAVPTVISMLVTSIYNMADTFFVGKLNTQSTAAVGIVFTVMAFIEAFGFFYGQGSGNYISRKLGAREYDDAAVMASTGFFMAIITGIVITIVGLVFLEPISLFLGYRIQSLSQDLFAFVAYIMFAVGWSIAATFVQFITLFALEKFKGK